MLSMKIGFIGLGQMGRHMAMNLLKKNVNVCVCDNNPAAVEKLAEAGASSAASAGKLASWMDAVFLSLPDTEITSRVLFGEDGVCTQARSGTIVVDLGTTSYMGTLGFGRRLAEKQIRFCDAPVSGMESRARDGHLTLMYGGGKDTYETMKPYFETFANCILNMGELGTGQLAKLINQLLFDINTAALSEMLGLAAKLGLDPNKTVQILNTGTGRSWASEFFGPRILEDNFGEGYAMNNAYKDLVSASELSAQQKIPLPILAAATAVYQTALCMGLGDGDKGSMVKVYEKILDVKFRK